MRVALTGGSGFVGRYLLREFRAAGFEVAALTRRSPDLLPQLPGVRWISGELGNLDDARHLVESADAVVHGGLHRQGKSFMDSADDPLGYWHRNATGSLNFSTLPSLPTRVALSSSLRGAVHDRVVTELDENHR